MIILIDENRDITGYQIFPETTKAPHILSDISEEVANKLVGRTKLTDDLILPDLDIELERIAKEDLSIKISELQSEIDQAAANVISKVLPYSGAAEEYRLTADQVREWRVNGENADAVPRTMQADMDSSGRTATESAALIESRATNLFSILEEVRYQRMVRKSSIGNAEGIEEAERIASYAIESMQGLLSN